MLDWTFQQGSKDEILHSKPEPPRAQRHTKKPYKLCAPSCPSWLIQASGLTISLPSTYFQTSALHIRPTCGGSMKRRLFVLPYTTLFRSLAAQDVASFEKRITVKTLDNGLTAIVCERPEAPVFSFYTHVDAGSSQDPLGKTGLAHMFEHMAFKGTDKIGTKDYPAEKAALAKVETAYAAYIAERDKRFGRDEAKLKQLQTAWQDAIKDANQYVIPNQFSEILERNGGEDINASTNEDETNYFYSLPENRLELWAYLESERFLHPVMREFYKERNVVIEERRMRTDSNPIGRLLEQFTTASFQASQYHRPTIGWMSDLNSFSAT